MKLLEFTALVLALAAWLILAGCANREPVPFAYQGDWDAMTLAEAPEYVQAYHASLADWGEDEVIVEQLNAEQDVANERLSEIGPDTPDNY